MMPQRNLTDYFIMEHLGVSFKLSIRFGPILIPTLYDTDTRDRGGWSILSEAFSESESKSLFRGELA